MPTATPERLLSIKNLPTLFAYLRDELNWPLESVALDEITFDWTPISC